MNTESTLATELLETLFEPLERVGTQPGAELHLSEFGTVLSTGSGIALVDGLPGVGSEELVRFPHGLLGLAYNLDPQEVGVILLGTAEESRGLSSGARARRTGRILEVPVGDSLLGRIVDPLGRPVDGRGPVHAARRWPAERRAPAILDRAPVGVPLQTGIKVVDALIPIGRGQRQLILGDRQTGKTTIALDTMLAQKEHDVICVYCAIGQRSAAIARLVAELRARDAMGHCIVVVASGEDPAGLQFIAPYAACTMAEHFAEAGRDVLIVYDDLTRHAWAYRELALLLRRPPGREAFPGDIFYVHSRLLERSARLRPERGGGSISALPIVETEAQNVAAYLPTNLISITDGQVYLSPDLFQQGILPAVDVGRSVSRVGGRAQLPAYRAVAGELRLAYAQFAELEVFSRFSARLDPDTLQTLERGRRVREILKQPQHEAVPAAEQIAVLLAASAGLLDAVPLTEVLAAERSVRHALRERAPELCQRLENGSALAEADRVELLGIARAVISAPAGG